MFYACLFGLVAILQFFLAISLVFTIVKGLKIWFYLLSPNIIWPTIVVLINVTKNHNKGIQQNELT